MVNLRDGPWLPQEEGEAEGAPNGGPFLESLAGKRMESQASITEDATFWVPSEAPLGARALEEGVVALGFMAPAL